MGNVTTCLWFDGQAEEAAQFYTSVVKNSRISDTIRFSEMGPGEPGSVMLVLFELDGQQFAGLNGGPQFPFTEAVSIHLLCDSQAEIDRLWGAFTADGGQEMQCGWLKDRFGMSWQIDSTVMFDILTSGDEAGIARATEVMFGMKKLDVQALQDAFTGAG